MADTLNKKVRIDPVTRIEGHLQIDVQMSGDGATRGAVGAEASAELYRGFENILYKRPVQDTLNIMQRI